MKILLHYKTTLGPRTIVAEVGDVQTAWAVTSAHQALGEQAALVEEMPRISMQDHLAKHKRRKARPALKVIEIAPNVVGIKRRAKP